GSQPWRAPFLWRLLPAYVLTGAGARPDHPINGERDDRQEREPSECGPFEICRFLGSGGPLGVNHSGASTGTDPVSASCVVPGRGTRSPASRGTSCARAV